MLASSSESSRRVHLSQIMGQGTIYHSSLVGASGQQDLAKSLDCEGIIMRCKVSKNEIYKIIPQVLPRSLDLRRSNKQILLR